MRRQIYSITNKINNKTYIGQSINAVERWRDHIWDANRKVGKTSQNKKFAIQNAINKYGKDNFIWQVIDEFSSLEESNEAEEFYIAYLCTLSPNGYNLKRGGDNKKTHESTKQKIREKLKIVGSFVGKKGKDHPNFGKKQSEKRKLAQSKKLSGDGGSNKKINSKIAAEIYLKYLNNILETPITLAKEYKLGKNTIRNILNKTSWKDATKDFPDINLKNRTCGEDWQKSKLKNKDIIDICEKYKTKKYSIQEIAEQYNVTSSCISDIVTNKSWKHIKR